MCWEKSDRWEELERKELERDQELQQLITQEHVREPEPADEREPELISR